MGEKPLLQFIALSIYVAFLGFIFCDFFKLRTIKKTLFFIVFLSIVMIVIKVRNEFDLSLILPVPTLLAIGLGIWQKRRLKQLNK
ncbi:MAG: hypothetical protein KKE64_06075 [Candidatus Omnitrophica bacterium]|nr:hypothetical protein [Candidatus Omnitrophota bacterium]